MRFRNNVVLVSGAGSGIGRGIAEQFGLEGAKVGILEINVETGRKAEHELAAQGIEAFFIETDVSNDESVIQATAQVAKLWGQIDVVINNAGLAIWKGIKDLSSEEWDRVLGVDLKSVFLLSKHSVPYMNNSKVKSIINISSVHANATVPHYDAYAASKGGILSLTRSMALTLKEDGIRVNAICPGFVDTELLTRYLETVDDPEAYMKYILSIHTVPRIGTPKDIAKLCMFLSSEDGSFINGEAITVDGGLSIQLKH